MAKRAWLAAVCLWMALNLTGCWNYRSLNNLSIVSGLAVDLLPDSNQFKISFEVVDLSENTKNTGPKTIIVESTGKTIFDAARNGKRRLGEKLYFGNMVIILVSEEVAAMESLSRLTDWFLRDAELRETTHLVITKEKTAADLLKIEGINNAVISFEINNILSDDHKTVCATQDTMMYRVFDILHSNGKSLTLPLFHAAVNEGKWAVESYGSAIFKGEKMIGELTPEETKYFLFITNQVQGGVLPLSALGEPYADVTLEISNNNTKCSYKIKDGGLAVSVETETGVYLGEITQPFNALDPEKITSLEATAGAALAQAMESVINKVQTVYRSDIFGFGAMIHQSDPRLWAQISGRWNDEYFPSLQVTVHAKVNILNSAFLKDTEEEKKQ